MEFLWDTDGTLKLAYVEEGLLIKELVIKVEVEC